MPISNRSLILPLITQALAVALFLPGTSAAMTPEACYKNLASLHEKDFAPEAALLKAFDPSKIVAAKTTWLSVSGVIRVELTDGSVFVVRFPSTISDPKFERFANEFLRSVPQLQAPAIRLLTSREIKEVFAKLHADDRLNLNDTKTRDGVSVATFFPLTKPESFLEAEHAMDPARQYIDFLSSLSPEKLSQNRTEIATRLKQEWKQASDESRRTLSEDLKVIRPSLAEKTDEEVFDYFSTHIDSFSAAELRTLIATGFRRLPSKVLRQLADTWAVYSVLAIPDFHAGNWLVHDGIVLAIDMAFRSAEFTKGRIREETRGPFLTSDLGPEMRAQLVAHLSPEFYGFLESLTAERIKQIARLSGFGISRAQINGVLQRAKRLLDGRAR